MLAGNTAVEEHWTPYGEMLSTAWLGVSSNPFRNEIFETMLFCPDSGTVLQRYTSECEARDGHQFWIFWTLLPPLVRKIIAASHGPGFFTGMSLVSFLDYMEGRR